MPKLQTTLFRRKKVFIDAKHQLQFCADLVLHALIFPVMVMVFLYIEPFSTYLLRTPAAKSRAAVADFANLCLVNWWIPCFVLVMLGFISVLFSHKIVGPIYRLHRNLENVMKGEKNVYFGLREGDYFRDFANLLSQYVTSREADND